MKILVVGEDYPWPANRGGLIRLGKIIEALAAAWARSTSSPSTTRVEARSRSPTAFAWPVGETDPLPDGRTEPSVGAPPG